MRIHDPQKRSIFEIGVNRLLTRQISRREFIRRAGALGVSAALISDVLRISNKAFAEDKPTPEVLEKIKSEGGRLYVYFWEDYFHPDTLPAFEEEFKVKVTYDTFPGNEQLLAKLQAGGVFYDVTCPTHNFLPIFIGQKLLLPLNHENIPNLKYLMPRFLDTPFDPGNVYSVPEIWGMTAIGHNSYYTKDDENLNSWALMFESGPNKYSGKIGFTDEREEVLATALKYLGYSANTHNTDQLMEAGELLMSMKPHIKAFYPGSEEKKALITEDLAVGHCWNGEVVMAHWKNPSIKWMLPKEGGTGWFDTIAIPKGAPHKFTAEVFINFLMRPEIAAAITNITGYASSNSAAKEFVDRKIVKNPAIYPSDEDLKRIEFLGTIPDEIQMVYDKIWTRLLGS